MIAMHTQPILTNRLTDVLAHIKDHFRHWGRQQADSQADHALPAPFFGWKYNVSQNMFLRYWNPQLLFDRKRYSLTDFLDRIEPADRNHFIVAHAVPLENLFSRSYCHLMDGPLTLNLVFRAHDHAGKSIGIAATSVFALNPESNQIDWTFVANQMELSQSEPFRLHIHHSVPEWKERVLEKLICITCVNPWAMTPAEEEVASLLAEGQTYKRIASCRGVQLSTVHSQVNGIYSKMGVKNKGKFLYFWKNQYRKIEISAA